MRIAHIIMVHKNSYQLERLIHRMNHPQFDFYIHLDKKTDIKSFEHMQRINGVFFIKNRINCNWGGFSFVNAITESIREVLKSETRYEFVNLMSGQDYPIKSIESLYQFYIKHQGYNFISYSKLGESDWWKHAASRYELYHFTDINIKGRYIIQRLLNRFLPKRKFPLPFPLYGSADSSWWTISSECAKYILSFLDKNPKLIKFMELTWGADEFLFPTIIMNSPFMTNTYNNCLRYILWEESKPNPKILKKTDLNALKYTDHFFARKFDSTIDEEVLNELDQYVDSIS